MESTIKEPYKRDFMVCHDGNWRSIDEVIDVLEDIFECPLQWLGKAA